MRAENTYRASTKLSFKKGRVIGTKTIRKEREREREIGKGSEKRREKAIVNQDNEDRLSENAEQREL